MGLGFERDSPFREFIYFWEKIPNCLNLAFPEVPSGTGMVSFHRSKVVWVERFEAIAVLGFDSARTVSFFHLLVFLSAVTHRFAFFPTLPPSPEFGLILMCAGIFVVYMAFF